MGTSNISSTALGSLPSSLIPIIPRGSYHPSFYKRVTRLLSNWQNKDLNPGPPLAGGFPLCQFSISRAQGNHLRLRLNRHLRPRLKRAGRASRLPQAARVPPRPGPGPRALLPAASHGPRRAGGRRFLRPEGGTLGLRQASDRRRRTCNLGRGRGAANARPRRRAAAADEAVTQ